MKKEEKELLLKDLCARLTNGVICSIYREDDEGFGWRDAECKGYFQTNHSYEFYFEDVIAVDNIEDIKPYLRPMSSMTEEEKRELTNTTQYDTCYKDDGIDCIYQHILGWEIQGRITIHNMGHSTIDWLNAHHFDYRGLIEKGLALPATEGMYK